MVIRLSDIGSRHGVIPRHMSSAVLILLQCGSYLQGRITMLSTPPKATSNISLGHTVAEPETQLTQWVEGFSTQSLKWPFYTHIVRL